MNKSLLPRPWLSLTLLLTWLLLQNSLALGDWALGGILALFLPWLLADFWPETIVVRKPLILVRLILQVVKDIVGANFHVAALILWPETELRPGFVNLPLRLKSEFAIAFLANTISLTPGTVAADINREHSVLRIHCLDLDDEEALIAEIRQRYETPLQEVFES